ncbi:MAG: hypothetical protein HOL93_11985, partial [Candidatus Marinimicrobia bacterium]|nr:hypothetical protein [Candidatus Neomarinimicrobiota bacterium]
VGLAAHGRLDLAMLVRTPRNLHARSVVHDEGVVQEGSVARAADGVDRHPAGRAFVGCHCRSPDCGFGCGQRSLTHGPRGRRSWARGTWLDRT